jgi:hypothetical protein
VFLFRLLAFLLFNHVHILRLRSQKVTHDVWGMSGASARILNRWDMLHVSMVVLWCSLFERKQWLQLRGVLNLLQLVLITLNLLLEVLNSLSYVLSDLKVVLHFLH